MESYRPKTALASAADHLLRVLLAWAAGVGWFVALWGLCLPALTAGTALGGLFWLCARLLGKKQVQKKEAALRQTLGGELALEKLLLASPDEAAFQCVQWLQARTRLQIESGGLGMWDGETVLFRLFAQHPGTEISSQQVSETIRKARQAQVQRILLCTTAPLSSAACRLAETAEPSLRLVGREELIQLAGACCPATDEDLCRLKQCKPKRRSAREWLKIILHPSRAKRYFWYGVGLAALTLATGQRFYPIPAAVCLLLFAGCKIYAARHRTESWS
ncbi:MAG: hypothetical protein SOX38_11005 [Candidatus Limiplasma sp.]|nr:hypothetical protein [Clostridiales bacterium]MDY3244450.1 hypothetical protein [Candidatus Limiplasma sp.]